MDQKTIDNELYPLDFNKTLGKLSFNKEINDLEFVEIIGNMGFDHCINYTKRDIYLKKRGKQLFKKFPFYKKKEQQLQIKIEHQIDYLSNEKNENNKFFDSLSKIIKNILNWKIIITINIIKYKHRSTEDIKQNNYDNHSKKIIDSYSTEVLSQEEIDMLLTAINSDDDEK
ncbi:MAG: hypothetical protein LBB61_09335 [Treponema sp.]|nr:hypothetical protein [Treponema sp.]